MRALAVAVMIAVVVPAAARAQPSAQTVLANVQQYYASASQLTAKFRQVVTSPAFGTTTKSDGVLRVEKPARFRWDYLERRGNKVEVVKSFVFDGATLWVVDHHNKQIFQNSAAGSALPAAVSFLTGGAGLAAQLTTAITTTSGYGGGGAIVLELTPKQPSAVYKQLLFVVEPSNWRVKESIVVGSNGDVSEFQFFSPDVKTPIAASMFQVIPANLPTHAVVVVGNGSAGSGSGAPPARAPARSGSGSGASP